jgi:DNA-directed RNA polymerase subunit RPC12/RpoP
MIEFLCPNGHKIRCQATQAGKAAKCPRCGVKFRVPDATDQNRPKTGDSDPSVSQPDFSDSNLTGKRHANTGSTAAKEPDFEFLCPNGHRLHGPANLQGRPGQCPDCGSRFRIPTYEDIPAEEETEQEIGLGRLDGREGSDIVARATTSPARSDTSHHGRAKETAATLGAVAGHATAAEATGALLARFWDMRPKGATVELRLRSGETITPDQFLAGASRESGHGVFATVEADATVSLVIVPWDAVDRMTIRGLKEVPQELAE